MANEIRVTSSLTIRKTSGTTVILNKGYSSSFQGNMSGAKGPVPGALTIPTTPEVVNFGELTTPGWCWLENLDATNYVEWGAYDPDTATFYPIGKISPGCRYPIELAPVMGQDVSGTGTTGDTFSFAMRADTAAVAVSVEAFEA